MLFKGDQKMKLSLEQLSQVNGGSFRDALCVRKINDSWCIVYDELPKSIFLCFDTESIARDRLSLAVSAFELSSKTGFEVRHMYNIILENLEIE